MIEHHALLRRGLLSGLVSRCQSLYLSVNFAASIVPCREIKELPVVIPLSARRSQWLSLVAVLDTFRGVLEDLGLVHGSVVFLEEFRDLALLAPRRLSDTAPAGVGCYFDSFKYIPYDLDIVLNRLARVKRLQIYLSPLSNFKFGFRVVSLHDLTLCGE